MPIEFFLSFLFFHFLLTYFLLNQTVFFFLRQLLFALSKIASIYRGSLQCVQVLSPKVHISEVSFSALHLCFFVTSVLSFFFPFNYWPLVHNKSTILIQPHIRSLDKVASTKWQGPFIFILIEDIITVTFEDK